MVFLLKIVFTMKDFLKTLLAVVLGTCLVLYLVVTLIFGTISSALTAFNGGTSVSIPAQTVLTIGFEEGVANQDAQHPISGLLPAELGLESGGMGYYSYVRAIEAAATDPQVTMIYLNPQYLQAQMAHLEEIRNALLFFRQSGKPIVAYADTYSQQAYYLASAADKVVLNPAGEINLQGFSIQVRYYKELFDKWGIEAQVIRHGDYKGGGENYMLSHMSDTEREQFSAYLHDAWAHWAQGMETSRHLPAGILDSLCNTAFSFAAWEARSIGLADELWYKDQLIDYICAACNVKHERQIPTTSLATYAQKVASQAKVKSRNKLALVYACGEMTVGQGTDGILSDNMAAQLRQYRSDSTVKAVVLRVDSPGGDPLAVEIIARELSLTAQVKPVVVSMGDMAASGGYWISAPAHAIFANPSSLTGSIGVFSLFFNGEKALEDVLHIHNEVVNTHHSSHFPSYLTRIDDTQATYLRQRVDSTYARFIDVVATGRHLEKDAVEAVAQGRIWSGVQAVQNHLADQLGGLSDALRAAALMANISDYNVVEYPQPESFLKRLVDMGAGYGLGVKTRLPFLDILVTSW